MKTKQRNGIKFNAFEREDIIEKLNGTEEDWNLVDKYQLAFPELLQDVDGFVIDGEILCKELGVKSNFNDWLLRKTKGKEGKLIKYRCIENTEFIIISEKSETKTKEGLKRGTIKNKILLTVECAKKIAMRQNNDMGDLVCNYFILIEKLIRNMDKWINTREAERKNYNPMINNLKQWCKNNNYDTDEKTFKAFRIKETNMINIALTGLTANDLQLYYNMKDKITRNHLNEKINKAIDELQLINSSLLLMDNLTFNMRKQIIDNTCKTKYSHLYIKDK